MWTCNGSVVEDGGRFKIKNNGNTRTLIIKKLKESDAGNYKLVATNKEGTAESTGTLEVVEVLEKSKNDAPQFLKKIGDEMVFR